MESVDDAFLVLFGEHQEGLLLKSDLWVRVPCLPPRGRAYELETSVPVANYEPPSPDLRHIGQGLGDEEDTLTEAPPHLDPPKWESAPAFLGASALSRLLVRGLGSRLRTLRIRFVPSVPMTGAPSSGEKAP